jgi:Zn finger protein HypA/HybF involved in hydrogenase expression
MSALRPSNGQHLDATAGREVVFCHSCSYEWFRDEQGLVCPRCQSEISELVSLFAIYAYAAANLFYVNPC